MTMALGMLRHHGPMLRIMARILLASAVPGRRRNAGSASASANAGAAIRRTIAPPPTALVERYIAWSGAAGRYRRELPPHMVSQWSTPLVGELLLKLPYRLTRVINQGVTLKVNGPLPRGVPLELSASLQRIEEAGGRAKVTVLIVTGTAQQAALVETQLHLSFILPGPRPAKAPRAEAHEPNWKTVGSWQARADDGLQFALLTGDLNPIHWCGPIARRSVFGGKVLHGFGSLVRSYEALPEGSWREIDIRFLRPVPLPSPELQVRLAVASMDGWRPLRLAGADAAVYLAGRCR
jgi:acyl dehydratase